MNNRQLGYTLIELLLVITVISIMSLLAISTYRKHAQTQRIEKTALEIQNILEAALAYHVDFDEWPNPNPRIPVCYPTDTNNVFIKNYLPNQNYQSNFGNNYCWAAKQTDNKGPLFWVALKTPASIATRIAAKLPNAVAVADPRQPTPSLCTDNTDKCFVRAEIAQPAASSRSKGGEIAGMGYCDPRRRGYQTGSTDGVTCKQDSPADHYTVQFSCSAGKQGQLYVVPNFYKSAALPEASPPTILTVLNAKTYNNPNTPIANSCKKKDKKSSEYTCHINITALYDKQKYAVVHPNKGTPGTIGAFYIAYCVTPSSPKKVTLW